MTDDLTPERAREELVEAESIDRFDWAYEHLKATSDRILSAWERDRAELLQRRRECARCGQTGLHPDGVHSCYDLSALSADYYQQWQEVSAERDALRERLAATESGLERECMRLAGCSAAALGYHTKSDEMHPDYDSAALQDVMRLRERLAVVVKQRDALHTALQVGYMCTDEQGAAFAAALAAIRAEREGRSDG